MKRQTSPLVLLALFACAEDRPGAADARLPPDAHPDTSQLVDGGADRGATPDAQHDAMRDRGLADLGLPDAQPVDAGLPDRGGLPSCRDDTDCGPYFNLCSLGLCCAAHICPNCVEDADCGGGFCFGMLCSECRSHADCPIEFPFCSSQYTEGWQQCLECRGDEDCGDAFCDEGRCTPDMPE
jgi:hypothetical protein